MAIFRPRWPVLLILAIHFSCHVARDFGVIEVRAASAKLLRVSRATLWRMIEGGLLQKIEVLPGSFRPRRADLETIATGQKNYVAMKTIWVRIADAP